MGSSVRTAPPALSPTCPPVCQSLTIMISVILILKILLNRQSMNGALLTLVLTSLCRKFLHQFSTAGLNRHCHANHPPPPCLRDRQSGLADTKKRDYGEPKTQSTLNLSTLLYKSIKISRTESETSCKNIIQSGKSDLNTSKDCIKTIYSILYV